MQSLNFTLELFKKYGVPFKLNGEERTEKELKVTRLEVSKEHVLKGHVQTYLKVIESLEKKKQKGRSSLIILFDGYGENDNRKMYDVPEIKSWVQKIVKNKPHLFYFMVNISDNYVHDMALCMVNPVKSFIPNELQRYMGTPMLVLNGADATPAIRKLTESAFLYAKKLKHTHEDLMDLCMTLLDNMCYEQHLNENKQRVQDA
ncbi:hypothetical protein EHV15_35270 [Paenibacillus oralis]|uniref:Uncharacterized protein n=1 Tax=Paenibacillus oralis TaxID=2490856 RepID=A0A3P3T9X4_9BACL|nr:hypothetical protein [Paenibacillus oralis]RRJ54836.1 hypothetical protein EHV15_35270 [Paenibacillus oralis]